MVRSLGARLHLCDQSRWHCLQTSWVWGWLTVKQIYLFLRHVSHLDSNRWEGAPAWLFSTLPHISPRVEWMPLIFGMGESRRALGVHASSLASRLLLCSSCLFLLDDRVFGHPESLSLYQDHVPARHLLKTLSILQGRTSLVVRVMGCQPLASVGLA